MSPTNWLVDVLLMLAIAAGSYWAGDHNRNNAWLAKQTRQAQAAKQALEAEVARSNAAVVRFVKATTAMQSDYATLEGKFDALLKQTPLVVYRPATDKASPAGAAQASPAVDGGSAAGPAVSGPVGPVVDLSLGAVWMWNSALTATDLPAGACGAADPTSAACAAGAGIGLEAAWANHAANAKSCAQDRLRQQQLIDFLNAAPGATP